MGILLLLRIEGSIQLSDGVERIGDGAFNNCSSIIKFRSPPLVTTIPDSMLHICRSMFSLELPKNIIQVERYAFGLFYSLRNVSLSPDTEVVLQGAYGGGHSFSDCRDLLQIFDTDEAIVIALQNRFNRLPIHGKTYFKSYHNTMTDEEIQNASMIGKHGDKLDPTGLQQDCLGMNPLHILACLTVQRLEHYQFMVDKYPANLIVGDAWWAVPLLYAVLGNAPSEVVQFLVNSYQFFYPNHEI